MSRHARSPLRTWLVFLAPLLAIAAVPAVRAADSAPPPVFDAHLH